MAQEMSEREPRQGYEHTQTGTALCENCADGYSEQDRRVYGSDSGPSLRPIVGHHPDLHCEGANCGMCINHEEGQGCGDQSDNAAEAQALAKTNPGALRGQRSQLDIPMNWEE